MRRLWPRGEPRRRFAGPAEDYPQDKFRPRSKFVRAVVDALRTYESVRLSPDRRRLAITIRKGGGRDVWIYELDRGAFRRVTSGPTDEFSPIWTPDGKRLILTIEDLLYNVYWKPVNTADEAERLVVGGVITAGRAT